MAGQMMKHHITSVQQAFLFAITSVIAYNTHINGVNGDPQVPCFFIFGDSLVDSGNNNHLVTSAKVNYKPYGIDFPGGIPTGRFTNGRTTVDILGQLLGFTEFIPPFATARGNVTLNGVNYASGAAGIRQESGQHLGARISMDGQLKNHKITVSSIIKMLGNRDSAQKYLTKCLYYVGMGSNDYLNNYFMPQFYPASHIYTPEQYAQLLINQYRDQIMRLYNYGARKVVLTALGPIGCTPYAIYSFGTNGSSCVDKINTAVQLFNKQLISLVDQLNDNFTDAKFIYVNTFGIGSDVSIGLSVGITAACCPVNEIGQCIPSGSPCPSRALHMFWDAIHPTEIVNLLMAIRYYNASLSLDTYPFDISLLAQLHL